MFGGNGDGPTSPQVRVFYRGKWAITLWREVTWDSIKCVSIYNWLYTSTIHKLRQFRILTSHNTFLQSANTHLY